MEVHVKICSIHKSWFQCPLFLAHPIVTSLAICPISQSKLRIPDEGRLLFACSKSCPHFGRIRKTVLIHLDVALVIAPCLNLLSSQAYFVPILRYHSLRHSWQYALGICEEVEQGKINIAIDSVSLDSI